MNWRNSFISISRRVSVRTWVCLLHLTQFQCHSFISHLLRPCPLRMPHFPLPYCLLLFAHFIVEFVNFCCLTLFLFLCCFISVYFFLLLKYCGTLLESLLSVAPSSPTIMEICLQAKSCKLLETRKGASEKFVWMKWKSTIEWNCFNNLIWWVAKYQTK